jgi:hypothetical protein
MTYLVVMKRPPGNLHRITADSFEMQGDHLIFLTAQGELAALFVVEAVQSFNLIEGAE